MLTNVTNNLLVEYANEGPITQAQVVNPRGYKNLKLTIDTFRRDGKRVKIESLKANGTPSGNAVFVHASVLGDFIEGLEQIEDHGINVSSQ